MEGIYGVYFGKELAGKVQVTKKGLYYHFYCRCQLGKNIICRLTAVCDDRKTNLGVVVPAGDGFGLETKLACKHLGDGPVQFWLIPKHSYPEGKFIPISPEEPFAYISRLKQAYLIRQNGQVGIILNPPPESD